MTEADLLHLWNNRNNQRRVQGRLLVARAAQALDYLKPGWAKLVDINQLSMISHTNCILGQVYAHRVVWYKPWTWLPPAQTAYMRGRIAVATARVDRSQAIFASPTWHVAWVEEVTARTGGHQ